MLKRWGTIMMVFDLEMTRNFLIEDCVFEQGDDAVVIKSGRNQDAWRLNTPTENIVVRNCLVLAGQTLLGVGSEISGGVRNIYMHDCEAPNNVHRLFFIKTNHRRGAFVENVYMEKIKNRSYITCHGNRHERIIPMEDIGSYL